MKLAFIFGPMSTGKRPFDFARIEDDPRGLTGTDGSFLGYASAMAARGHEVTIFAALQRERTTWSGCEVRPLEERRAVDGSWDAALSWNDLRPLRDVSTNVMRVADLQVNDFGYSTPEDHEPVDLYLAPSAPLVRRLAPMAAELGGVAPWLVLPNGCDPGAYAGVEKVPGRCIFASSPDRGLHVALEQWGRIRAAVPHATLRVFYHALDAWIADIPNREKSPLWTDREHARRAAICRDLVGQPGVEVVGSVSRRRMAREYAEAEALLGPTDTISFTEGFAVAVLEGCVSGAVPCLTSCDALGEIYAGACPIVEVEDNCQRFADHPDVAARWTNNVIGVLGGVDPAWRDAWERAGKEFAARHAWPVLADRLEGILRGEWTGSATF